MKKKFRVKISPSILDSNFAEIKKTIKILERAKVNYIHFDVMDGNFVPNLTFGPKLIKPLRRLTKLPFDTHLMIKTPGRYIKDYVKAGSDIITFHFEAAKNPAAVIRQIKKAGLKAGMSIKPKTPVKKILKYVKDLDLILIMSVEPGFGGQKFMKKVLTKAKILRKSIDENKYKCLIEIDGGINTETAPLACSAGVDIIVAGSFIFKSKNPKKTIADLRKSVERCRQ